MDGPEAYSVLTIIPHEDGGYRIYVHCGWCEGLLTWWDQDAGPSLPTAAKLDGLESGYLNACSVARSHRITGG